ncbi:ATPase, partial [Kibdelosporangium lantanae]
VSPPGGDMTEPVTALTERFVRCRWMLDRDLAYARHYPAVSWAGSYSLDGNARHPRMMGLLAEAARLADMVDLVGISALPAHERVVVLAGRLIREGVLQQSALSVVDASSDDEKSAALVECVLSVVDECERLVGQGVPAEQIEDTDFGPVLRARTEATTVAEIGARRDDVVARLRELT